MTRRDIATSDRLQTTCRQRCWHRQSACSWPSAHW